MLKKSALLAIAGGGIVALTLSACYGPGGQYRPGDLTMFYPDYSTALDASTVNDAAIDGGVTDGSGDGGG